MFLFWFSCFVILVALLLIALAATNTITDKSAQTLVYILAGLAIPISLIVIVQQRTSARANSLRRTYY